MYNTHSYHSYADGKDVLFRGYAGSPSLVLLQHLPCSENSLERARCGRAFSSTDRTAEPFSFCGWLLQLAMFRLSAGVSARRASHMSTFLSVTLVALFLALAASRLE